MIWRELIVLGLVEGHSWLDCTDRREDGSCGGYIRNFQGHFDQVSTYKILNHDPWAKLCDPRFQARPDKYTARFPMAKAQAGQRLYFDYFENGHINLDRKEPDMRPHPRHYGIYWTGKPFLGQMGDGSQLVWRGDIRGRMPLELRSFDDGECSDINYAGRLGPTPCIGGYSIPNNTLPGIYQFTWVWHYDHDLHGSGEEYTSCFDVEVLEESAYKIHKKRIFPKYNPLDAGSLWGSPGESTPPVLKNPESSLQDCSSPTFDPSIHVCLSGGTVLCPIGNLACGKGQCYSPLTHQCCFESHLLPVSQACNIISNPFKRLARLKEEGY